MKTASQAYADAINAPSYQIVSPALASAMVTGKRCSKGTVFGTFSTEEAAREHREKQCKYHVPAGKNLKTGKAETIRTYSGQLVMTVRGISVILD
jgi:hypothetical protein